MNAALTIVDFLSIAMCVWYRWRCTTDTTITTCTYCIDNPT